MFKSGKKIAPTEKRGGARRPMPRKQKKLASQMAPRDYYKDNKGTGVFSKRLAQYRILICTDLETDDMAALTMFTAWIKANETYFDSRSNFPIYGFVVGETHNKRVKAQRVREYLKEFADTLAWNDTEHHLYKGFQSAGSRVWFDGETDRSFDGEDKLLVNPKVLDDNDYPDPVSFITGIDELMEVKPSNLFILYLKPLRFFQSLRDRPEVFEYLRQVPSAMYGGWNVRSVIEETPELKDNLVRFLNRTRDDAPLLFAESYHAVGEDNTITPDNTPKLFEEIDEAGDDELIYKVNQTMYAWNDSLLNRMSAKLQKLPEFNDTDFDDYQSYTDSREKLSPEDAEKYLTTLKVVDSIIKHGSRQFVYGDPLVIIAMLIGAGTIKKSPFRLQRSTISYDRFSTITADESSNTHVLVPKESVTPSHVKKAQKFLEGMLLAAIKITRGNE